MAVAAHGHGLHHRAAQFPGHCVRIDGQPPGAGRIGHVQRHQRRPAQAPQLQHQAQVHEQFGASTAATIRFGAGLPSRRPSITFPIASLLGGRGRVQAGGTGQIDHHDRALVQQPRPAGVELHRHTGERIDQRGLAAVGVADPFDVPFGCGGNGRRARAANL
jgi:hypothetical protein